MASPVTAEFFENGSNKQFEWVLSKYQETLQAKADGKPGKAEALLKLDKWYQNDLPKKIKSRGKEAHLTHEEIVQTIKWKLARGVFRPRLKDLIQMNTPRVVVQESKKAFRAIFKRNDLESACNALSNLKGVGPAMASAVLAAGCPELAPFMADECLLSLEGSEGIDYTMKEYMKLVAKTQQCVDRLNEQGGSWTPHKVEMAVWTHYVARDLKPEILENLPPRHEAKADRFNGDIDSDIPANGEGAREDTPENGAEAGEPEKNGDTEEMLNGEEERPSSAGDADPEPLGFAEQQEPQGFAEQQQQHEVEEDLAPASELQEEVMAAPLDHCQDSSDLPTETSAAAPEAPEVAREVPVAVTNGSSHGTNGVSAALQEAQITNNGHTDSSPAVKRPLDEEEEQPQAKKLREEQEEPAPATEQSPAPALQQPQQLPIHTGAD